MMVDTKMDDTELGGYTNDDIRKEAHTLLKRLRKNRTDRVKHIKTNSIVKGKDVVVVVAKR